MLLLLLLLLLSVSLCDNMLLRVSVGRYVLPCAVKVRSVHLCSMFFPFSMFLVCLYLFKVFLGYFAPQTCGDKITKTNSTNAKPVNFTIFTRTTIHKIALFLWSIPSCFLINFVF